MRSLCRSLPGPWRPLAMLAAAVLPAHLLVLALATGWWAPVRPTAPHAAAVRLRTVLLAQPAARTEGASLVALAQQSGPPNPRPVPPLPAPSPAPRRIDTATTTVTRGPSVDGAQAASMTGAPLPVDSADPAPQQAGGPSEPGQAVPTADSTPAMPDGPDAGPATVAAASGGEPPPRYPARWPPAATLRYALHYHGQEGEAVLDWRPSGARYHLQLTGLADPVAEPARQRPLIEQVSEGRLEAHGLVPERFTDRRRGRAMRAANFRHGLGRIEFSGASSVLPDWAGAQDRLSWWVQLPAIVAAAAAAPMAWGLFVVDAQGGGELWRLQARGPQTQDDNSGPLQYWRHEPLQPDGQRVEVWLDPAQGHWPVRVRLTLLRSGSRQEMRLLALSGPAP